MDSKKSFKITSAIALLYVLGALFFTIKIIKNTEQYNNKKKEFAILLNYENRLLKLDEWFGGESYEEDKLKKSEKLIIEAEQHLETAKENSLWVIILTLVFAMAAIFLNLKSPVIYHSITLSILSIAVVFLIIGVFTPFLEINAYKKDMHVPLKTAFIDMSKTFKGKMYFYYQNKSVMQLITMLFKSKNYVVGISIFCFSFLIPFSKLSLSLIVLFIEKINSKKIHWIIQNIGKWSMADVFVAAIFLAYLSFNNMQTGIKMESRALMGLYYFFTYCVLSISSSYLLKKAVPVN